jgi:hypothetical protein
MTEDVYQAELYRLLGVRGPAGECIPPGLDVVAQVYKLPDGSNKYIVPPTTDDARKAVIEELRNHLGIIKARRENNGPKKDH